MANKKLPGGRKSAGRVSASEAKLVSLKTGAVGVAISELPAAESLSGIERFPVVQGKETRGATIDQVKEMIPAGAAGASAFEVWAAAQPEGEDISEAAFIAFMAGKSGKDGADGTDGLSAYQIWAAAQPESTDTSEAAYLEFMQGKNGRNGDNGTDGESAYQIWVAAQEEGADTSEEAYLAFQAGKEGAEGKSTYQIWLDAGNEGTEENFLEWLQVSASVEIDPQKTNLVKMNADGLFVNGVHPIIPKYASSTLNGLLDTFKSMADGTRVYTMTVSLSNPLGITQLGGVAIQRYISAEPQYLFTNENNEYIPAQYFITKTDITAATIKATVTVIMPDKPYKSWDLSTLEEVASAEGGTTLQCKVGMRLLAGTNPSQNGMS